MEKTLHILFVENRGLDVFSLLSTLENAGIITELDVAESVEAAIQMLKQDEYDAVLIDHQMPVGHSMKLIKAIRQLGLHLPFIISDTTEEGQVVLDMLKAGAREYLIKGVWRQEELSDTVKHSMKVYQLNIAGEESLEEIQTTEQRFRMVINNSPDAIVTYDEDDVILDWNLQAEILFGWKSPEVIGSSFSNTIFSSSDKKRYTEMLSSFQHQPGDEQNIKIEVTGCARNQREVPIELISIPIKVKGRFVFIAFMRDLSIIKEQQRALNEMLDSLKETTRELQRSNKELEQFAYIASHDLQEPLRMITNYVQLLRIRYKDKLDVTGNEFVTYLLNGANRMKILINDLLEYSRVGRQHENFDQVNLNTLIGGVLDNLRETIQETGTEVFVDNLPFIHGDPAQLSRLFQNLLSNAIKFRGEKSPIIHLSAQREENKWHFTVKDNGIGIREDHLDKIFVIFQRLHSAEDYPGTGIGLAVAKKIVENHGGEIWVTSKIGDGTTFHFTLVEKVFRRMSGNGHMTAIQQQQVSA